MSNTRISGSWLVFIGALLWSLNSPLVKYLSIDSRLICGLRALIAAAALLGFLRPKQLCWNRWLVVYLCSYTALSLSVVLSLSLTSAPIAIGMQYTAIIWLFFINFALTRKFSLRSFIPVCIIFIGVILFMTSGTTSANSLGNLIALSEGIFFTGITVSAKKVTRQNPVGLVALGNLFAAVVVFLLFPDTLGRVPAITGKEWCILLILGILQVGGGYAFYSMGLLKVSAQRASILALWELILGPLWVALFLHEYPSLPVIIGFMIIIAGIFIDAKINMPTNAVL